jgi:hypothetical protein
VINNLIIFFLGIFTFKPPIVKINTLSLLPQYYYIRIYKAVTSGV